MPVQAARTLNNKINGGEVAHHRVEVEIERLLDNLRCNNDASKPLGSALLRGARLAETVDNFLLDNRPVSEGEASMKQAAVKLGGGLGKRLRAVDSVLHRISDPDSTSACSRMFDQR